MSKLTLPSGRTLDEALEATHRRTATLRRRRWAKRSLPVILALVAVPAALAAVPSDKPVAVTVADSPTTTTTEAVTTTTTTAPPTTTTSQRPPTSAPAKGDSSLSDPDRTPPTTTAPAPRYCAAAEMSFRAATASSTYKSGAAVPVSASIRNVGQSPCIDTSATGYVILNSEGEALNAAGWPDGGSEPSELQPGQSRAETIEWDGRLCDTEGGCYDAPPGTYTVRVRWGEFGTADTAPITVN